MGEDIHQSAFSPKDYNAFSEKLIAENRALQALIQAKEATPEAEHGIVRIGYELEACLLDKQGLPVPGNQSLLEDCRNACLTEELARYNLEINGHPQDFDAGVFLRLQNDLDQLMCEVSAVAEQYGTQVGLFGILPSLRDAHFDPAVYMSPRQRYRQISRQLIALRGAPVTLQIEAEDSLSVSRNDVMLEALGTSLQIHLQVPWTRAVDYYHAALWASMMLVGIAANSSLVLGRRGWLESRIPVFEQSVDTRNANERACGDTARVFFANGWINSVADLFTENLEYQPILPEVHADAADPFHHVQFHNGTIWRWVRPILGRDADGDFHFRLELRVPPAGPSQIDSMANLAFVSLLVEALSDQNLSETSFAQLQADFYQAAQTGLQARVHNLEGEEVSLQDLIVNDAVGRCRRVAKRRGLDARSHQLLDLIEQRARNGQTGARWLLQSRQLGRSDRETVQHYLRHAAANQPVHEWPC